MKLAMGIYDAPQLQKQTIFYVDPHRQNIAVFGGPMTGKTTFLKTFLTRIHEDASLSARENIYVVDFGGALGDYSQLGSICAYFDDSNEENIKRVFKTLEFRMAENAKALKGSNFVTLFEKDPEHCPIHLLLIIENLNSFLADERYSGYHDRLLRLCRDGLSKGLSILFTANDIAGTNRFLTNFGQKVAFEMPADHYYDFFNTKVVKPMKLPGRGLVNIDSAVYEFQSFVPFLEEEEQSLAALIEQSRKIPNPNVLVSFDGDLTLDRVAELCPEALREENPASILVGLDYYEHKPVRVNILESRSIAIYGKRKFGKTNLLRLLMEGIDRAICDYRCICVDDGRKELEAFRSFGSENLYLTRLDQFREYLISNGYGGRGDPNRRQFNQPPKPPTPVDFNTPFTVFVLQSKALYQPSVDGTYLLRELLPELIGNAEARKFLFLFTDVRSISSPEATVPFNNSISTAFLLDNVGDFVADKGSKSVFGEMEAKELKAEYAKCSVGDGYYYSIDEDDFQKLRFILAESEERL